MGRSLGTLTLDLIAKTGGFEAGMDKAARVASKRTREIERQAKETARNVEAAFDGIGNSIKIAMGAMGAGIAATSITGFVQDLAQAQQQADKLRNSLTYSTGSAEGAAKELGYLRDVTRALGLDFNTASQAYAKFAAATKGSGVSAADTRNVFEGIAAAAAKMGLSADETGGALLALSQMASKGTVSAEELRGQLGERLPGAFKIAAESMGVTQAELGKLLETGQVLASDFLPKFGRALKEEFGGSVNSLTQEINRLNSSWDIWKQNFANSNGGGFKWLTDGINESAAAMRSLGKDAGVVQRLLMAIGGFQFGALGAGKFDTQKLQEQAFQRLAEVKAQKKPLESKDYLNQFDKQTLADLKREEQAVRDLINELAVRRGKETGFQKPDLAGEYLAQQAKQNERVNGYLGDTSNTPKTAKIAAEIEKENKAFEAAVAGMVETDSRYIAALKAHNERVASIKSKGAEKAKKSEKAEAEIDPLTDAAKLYESTMKALDQAQLKVDMSGQTLTATQAELMRVMDNPRFAQMPESWQAIIKAQADYVIQAEQSAESQRRLNDLLAATPTAQLERQRETMLFLTDAFKAGKISAEQFSEAASTALGNIPEQAEPAKSSFLDLTTVANDAARSMADGFTNYLFDPMNNSIKDMLLNFLRATAKMIAQAAMLQLVKVGMAAFGLPVFAKGGVFDSGGVQAFASGGVVNSPTPFKFASGGSFKSGLMGEAGPEAILPLKRGADGKLGVTVTGGGSNPAGVNINIVVNEGDGEQKDSSGDKTGAWTSFAGRIKTMILNEMAEQKRPGGLLYA